MKKLWSTTAMTLAALMAFNGTIGCSAQTASEDDVGTASAALTPSLVVGGTHYDVGAISEAESRSAREGAIIESESRATLHDGRRMVIERASRAAGLVTAEGYLEKDGIRTPFSVANLREQDSHSGGLATQDFGLSALLVVLVVVVIGGALCLQANSNASAACAAPQRVAMGCSLVSGVGTGGGTSSSGVTFYLGCTASCICPNAPVTPPPVPVPVTKVTCPSP